MRTVVILAVSVIVLGCADEECKVCPPAKPTRFSHRSLSATELMPILQAHSRWLDDNKHDKERLKLHWSDPRRADLSGADLSSLQYESDAAKHDCLKNADLEWADLREVNLAGVDLTGTDLTNVDLARADLDGTILTNVELSEANLSCTMYEPSPGGADSSSTLPKIGSLALARNLCLLTFHDSPHGLTALREALAKSGDREQERQVTFALNYEARRRDMGHQRPGTPAYHPDRPSWPRAFWNDPHGFLAGAFNLVAFELTSAYGMRPGRPLQILALLIFVFAVPYGIAIVTPGAGGIYRLWPKDGIEKKDGVIERVDYRVTPRNVYNIVKYALLFSAASAFQIGWHDLNVGNWIDRMHAHEYALRAIGWPRTLAGVQAIASGFLLALWVLCYFGRPFG